MPPSRPPCSRRSGSLGGAAAARLRAASSARRRNTSGRPHLAPQSDPASAVSVNETLRLRPAVDALVRPRTAPLSVAGYELPPGVVVTLPIPLVHRDPRVFAEPHV